MDASKQIKTTIDVLIHIIILFSFLSLFFFLYISRIESDAFKTELAGMISDHINKFIEENPSIDTSLYEMQPYIKRFMDRYNKPTGKTLERNIMLKFLSIFVILLLSGITISIILTASLECNKKLNISHIILQNIIVFIFIGIVEYNFFTHVASKYIPVMPSLMASTMVETLKAEIKV